MIVSVSRRTDVPAFYSEWFYNRLKSEEVLSVNPFNRKQVSRISLKKNDVDCFIFWTKNPKKFIERLDELNGYNYYFQFTLNSYSKDVEPLVPDKREVINTFKELSKRIGKEKVIWRYDPILLNEYYTIEYHLKWFERLTSELCDYTERVVISFIDIYKKTKRNSKGLNLRELDDSAKLELAKSMSAIAKRYNLRIETCSESIDLDEFNIHKSKCIDVELISQIIDTDINYSNDQNQRDECGCIRSVDIGVYNTCLHMCKYCYANFSENVIKKNIELHDVNSKILLGNLRGDEKITHREAKRDNQIRFDI
ncbi:DUF1848 domain-containing protein [Mycoplasmatota bacterium]|nr:DUF1848 domain-containing protein [Mycoplasmatota bacterium]